MRYQRQYLVNDSVSYVNDDGSSNIYYSIIANIILLIIVKIKNIS